jgi:probable phosphoglycerate mutase
LDADGLAALVMHGGTARALIGSMLDLPPEHWWRLAPLGNCCWSLLVQADNGWRLAEHGVGVQETAQPASSPDTDPDHGPKVGDAGMTGF